MELKRFWGLSDDSIVGMVKNNKGFYRYFDLTNTLGNPRLEGSIRRAAGNYPIQSFAAVLYKFTLKRLYDRLIKENLDDKVIFNMFIHDELLFSVHKSVDPRRIAKICSEECMFNLKGHTTYFIGLGFGRTWLECKKDANELPSGLLMRMAKNYNPGEDNPWTDNPNDVVLPILEEYKKNRVKEVLDKIEDDWENKGIVIDGLADRFTNYKVRGYVLDYPRTFSPSKHLNSEDKEIEDSGELLISCLCNYLKENNYGNCNLIENNKVYTIDDYVSFKGGTNDSKVDKETNLFDVNFDDDIYSDSYVSFDTIEDQESAEHVMNMYDYDDGIEESLTFNNVRARYRYVKISGKDLVIKCLRPKNIPLVKQFLDKYKSSGGRRMVVESVIGTQIIQGNYDPNLDKLDELLKEVN